MGIPPSGDLGLPSVVENSTLSPLPIIGGGSPGLPSVGGEALIQPVGIPRVGAVGPPAISVVLVVPSITSTSVVGTPGSGTTGGGVYGILRPADVPLPYIVGQPPPGDMDPIMLRFLMQELARAQETVNSLSLRIPQEATSAPERPPNKLIRYARLPWDPLGTAPLDSGWVYWNGTAWIAL